jgi:hypothetical protein
MDKHQSKFSPCNNVVRHQSTYITDSMVNYQCRENERYHLHNRSDKWNFNPSTMHRINSQPPTLDEDGTCLPRNCVNNRLGDHRISGRLDSGGNTKSDVGNTRNSKSLKLTDDRKKSCWL